jgi:ribosomal protein L24E
VASTQLRGMGSAKHNRGGELSRGNLGSSPPHWIGEGAMYARRKSKAPRFASKKPIVSQMQLRRALQKIAEDMRRKEEASRRWVVSNDITTKR